VYLEYRGKKDKYKRIEEVDLKINKENEGKG
jgi:hypothetical protein